MLCIGAVGEKNTGRGQLFCGNSGGLTVVLSIGDWNVTKKAWATSYVFPICTELFSVQPQPVAKFLILDFGI